MKSNRLLSDKELLDILSLSDNATAIYTTEEIIIQTANDAMISFWGKDRSVIGKPLAEAVPELKEQPFIEILQNVWRTGVTYEDHNCPAVLNKTGKPETFYFDFTYRAIKKESGEIYCILHTATDVTERVQNQKKINIAEEKFKSFIMQAPVAIAILRGRNMVIELANADVIRLCRKDKPIIGLPLAEALPEIKEQPFLKMLDDVYTSGQEYHGYETKAFLEKDGKLEDFYFDFVYHPVKDENGQTYAVMLVATEVTQRVKDKQKLMASAKRLASIIMRSPVGKVVMTGPDLIIEEANEPMQRIWGRERKELIGHSILEVSPELSEQIFLGLIREVFSKGVPVSGTEVPAKIRTSKGEMKEMYIDFTYNPLFDVDGNVESIVANIIDVTKNVESRHQLESQKEELQKLNDDLSAINEEFAATNEELAATNEELISSNENLAEVQQHLERSLQQLSESEYLFRSIFEQSNMAFCLLRGKDLVTQLANDKILEIWGRTREEIIGKPQAVARPELEGQGLLEILRRTYDSGETIIRAEYKAEVYSNGGTRSGYFNSVYQPLKNNKDEVTGVLVILEEVTDKVTQRLKAERIQEEFQQAVSTAALGTWSIDAKTYILQLSERAKELFRLPSGYDQRPDTILNVIDPAYRNLVSNAIRQALNNHEPFDLDFPVTGVFNQERKWVRGTGRMFLKANGEPDYLAGILMDITERKEDEARKNDFIAMVSHELKTPLTLLKGYMQLVTSRRPDDSFINSTLTKALQQTEKMHTLIKGFLDVARIESGKIPLNKQTVLLHDVLTEVLDDARVLYEGYNIEFTSEPHITILADKDKIMQVITNFLSNAVKYSPKGSSILVSTKITDGMAQVSVKDNGMGINKHDINNLFQRFYRVENNHTKSISGFGIGLYLCAEIIKRHGGTIGVESEMGEGSTFWFALPVKDAEGGNLLF